MIELNFVYVGDSVAKLFINWTKPLSDMDFWFLRNSPLFALSLMKIVCCLIQIKAVGLMTSTTGPAIEGCR